jgi:hypothetical protein
MTTVTTLPVSIKTVTVAGRKLTEKLFRQLPHAEWAVNKKMNPALDKLLGIVLIDAETGRDVCLLATTRDGTLVRCFLCILSRPWIGPAAYFGNGPLAALPQLFL